MRSDEDDAGARSVSGVDLVEAIGEDGEDSGDGAELGCFRGGEVGGEADDGDVVGVENFGRVAIGGWSTNDGER